MPGGAGGPPGGANVDYAATSKISVVDGVERLSEDTKAIETDPKFMEGFNNRGLAYSGKAQYDKAMADYSKAIELDPKSGEIFNIEVCFITETESMKRPWPIWTRPLR
jgi:tetratricopeptide (TPR) repeat protein